MTNAAEPVPTAPRTRSKLAYLPLALFAVLAALFLYRLGTGDSGKLPSALIGKPAPTFALPPLEGVESAGKPVPGLTTADFKGQITLVNVFASWCGPCHEEHPFLMQLAKDTRIRLVGINYKDQPDNARRFIGKAGNPYVAIGVDQSGRAAIDWGVYGVPETFLIGRDGTILYKFVGPISDANLNTVVRPQIEKALVGG
jgi:cytochrome c biogenesis protein CcmG, thiol:disulfide interchange protein DsbE